MSTVSKEREMFAPDLRQAESQNHNLEGSPAPDINSPNGDQHRNATSNNDSPYAKYYRHDADIWSLYLKETEAEDKELVGLWKTGLDSLLVFAGLFAGILTAFIIESRKGLQDNAQESLLKEILATLRNDSNQSTSTSFRPSTSSLHVNYLWFTSLTLTLMSALTAVLAKDWLGKYAPASPGVSSGDACERHLRATRAQQWRFGALIGGIPLLIQIALFLFFGGLVRFVLDDNRGIGYTILAFIIFMAIAYLVGTILPWLSPASPFQTTMSDFLPGIAKKAMYRRYRASSYEACQSNSSKPLSMWGAFQQFVSRIGEKPGATKLEAEILSWIIAYSTVDKNIEEAVKAIAGMPSTHFDVLQTAMAKYGAASALCERFSRLFTFSPGLAVMATDVNLATAYLYALHAVVGINPESLPHEDQQRHPCLVLWQSGGPLHRWDNLQPCLQSLAFCIRCEILLVAGQDDHAESWEEVKSHLKCLNQTGSPRNVQRMLMDVAIRSVASKSKALQKIGAVVLSSIIKIGKPIQQFGTFEMSTGELTFGLSKVKVSLVTIAQNLYTMSGLKDPDISKAAITALIKLTNYELFVKSITSIGGHMICCLEDSNSDVRSGATFTIGKLAKYTTFHDVIKGVVPYIVGLLKDENSAVRLAGAKAIGKLAKQITFHDELRGTVPQIVELIKDSDFDVQFAGVNVIGKFAEQTTFHNMIKSAVPDIIEFLKASNSHVQSAGVGAIERLACQTAFHDVIKGAVPQIVELLKDSDVKVHKAAKDAFERLAKQTIFSDAIKDAIPQIFGFFKDTNFNVQQAGAIVIRKLAEQTTFHDVIMGAVPWIVEFLESSNSNVRYAAADAIGKLAEQTIFCDAIKDAVPQVIELLKDSDSRVQWAGADAIGKLAEQTTFCDAIKDAVPQIIELLKDSDSRVQWAGAIAIGKLAEQTTFHCVMKDVVPPIIQLLKDRHSNVQCAGATAIGRLGEQTTFHDAIKGAVPQIVELVMDNNFIMQWVGTDAIRMLAKQTTFHDEIKGAVPQIIKLFQYSTSHIQWDAATRISKFPSWEIIEIIAEHVDPTIFEDSLLKFLAEVLTIPSIPGPFSVATDLHGNSHNSSLLHACSNLINEDCELRYNAINYLSIFSEYIRKCNIKIPHYLNQVINQLTCNNYEVHKKCMMAISTWAEYTTFHDMIKESVPQIIKLFKDSCPLARLGGATTIEKLAEQTTFHYAISGAVPQIIELLSDSNFDVQLAGVNAVGKLAEQARFHDDIKGAVPCIVGFLKDDNSDVRFAGAKAIGKLAKQTTFHDAMKDVVPSIIQLLKDRNSNVRLAGTNAIGRLAEQTTFHNVIKDTVPQIVELLKDSSSDVQLGGATAIGELAEQSTFYNVIKDAVPQIVQLLKDNNSDVQLGGVYTIGRLAEQTIFHDEIKDVVPLIIQLLKDRNSNFRLACANFIGRLAKQSTFHNMIKDVVPQIVELLKDSNSDVRLAGANVIGKLAEETLLHYTIKGAVPNIIDLLKHSSSDVRLAGVNAIGELTEQIPFHNIIKGTVPQIIELLKDSNFHVQLGVAKAFGKLAEQTAFHNAIKDAVPEIVESLKDSNSHVQLGVAKAIGKLVQQTSDGICLDLLVELATSLLKTGPTYCLHDTINLISNLPNSALPLVAKTFSASDLFSILQYKDSDIAGSCAHLFSKLFVQSKHDISHSHHLQQFTDITLKIVVYALSCIHCSDREFPLAACGISILTQLTAQGDLQHIISDVHSIWEFLRLYMKSISSEQREKLLYNLQEFGILQTL